MDSAIEADPLHSELRILDWILHKVCSNEKYERTYINQFLEHLRFIVNI